MTTIFLYEHLCALANSSLPSSWLVEGRAMRDALAEDFSKLPNVRLILGDSDDERIFRDQARAADWSLIIAPESDGILEERCRWVCEAGGRLLGHDSNALALTGDKWQLAKEIDGVVPHPQSWLSTAIPKNPPYPQVWKPRDGAGSVGMFLVKDEADAVRLNPSASNLLRQEFIPGRTASVASLCGPKQKVPLIPCLQNLGENFAYLGGETPIDDESAKRVLNLAWRAIEWLSQRTQLLGWIGFDVILGEHDVLIEINPRLTTSYIGLRQIASTNLAEAMLRIAEGKDTEIEWRPEKCRFRSDGSTLKGI